MPSIRSPLPSRWKAASCAFFPLHGGCLIGVVAPVFRSPALPSCGIDRLESSDVRAVHVKTEGWPAILRIIASTFSRSGAEFAQFASKLSGAVRPIGAYFDEMLDGLPSVMVQFMVRTAILDRFSAPLCQAITRVGASGELLFADQLARSLEQSNEDIQSAATKAKRPASRAQCLPRFSEILVNCDFYSDMIT